MAWPVLVRKVKLPRFARAADLKSPAHRSSAAVARALRDVPRERFDRLEVEWLQRIDALRGRLSASRRSVTFRNFGAADLGDRELNADEMYEGRMVTMTLGRLCQNTSFRRVGCLLAFKVVRLLRAENCLELGTCIGLSACYQAAALDLNGYGSLTSLEGAEPLASIARENFEALGLSRVEVCVGRFQDTLAKVLSDLRRVDFGLIDGHHDEAATLGYFEQLQPYLPDGSVLLFDDIRWSHGMTRAWQAIAAEPRVATAIDLGAMGLCVIGLPDPMKRTQEFPL